MPSSAIRGQAPRDEGSAPVWFAAWNARRNLVSAIDVDPHEVKPSECNRS
jgi:hypothetical protein